MRRNHGTRHEIRKILVVDDEPAIRKSISRVIQHYFPDCEVAMASDGMEAAEKIQTMNPHLAILDLGLPHIGGLELCEIIRDQPMHAHTRVLVITGSQEQDIHKTAFAKGAYEFLLKPFQADELAGSINRLL